MREALSALTVRGRAFLAAGITAVVCAILLGQPTLTRVGILVAALPLITAATLGRSRYRLALVRSVGPQTVTAGQPATVEPDDDQRGPDAQRRAACWRTTSPTCSAPGRASCSTASATAGAGTRRTRCAPTSAAASRSAR